MREIMYSFSNPIKSIMNLAMNTLHLTGPIERH